MSDTYTEFYEYFSTPIMRKKGIGRVKPQRYVWHVGGRGCDADMEKATISIERYGLLAMHSRLDAVFANNQSEDITEWYPTIIEQGFPLPIDRDIWRIDTQICKVRWYADVNMLIRPTPDWEKHVPWIFTPSNIPRRALKRYRLLPEPEEDRFLIQKGNGVTSFIGPRLSVAPFPWGDDAYDRIWERAA